MSLRITLIIIWIMVMVMVMIIGMMMMGINEKFFAGCPPIAPHCLRLFFPTMLVMLNNVSGDVTLLALSVIVVMDAPSTLSATDKLPLYGDWIFARSSISCLLWATLTSDEHINRMKYNQDIELKKEPCILPKEFSFSDQHQEEVLCWPLISWGDLLRSVRFIRVWHFRFDFFQAWLPSTFD